MKTPSLRARRHRNPQHNVDVQNQTAEHATPFFSNGQVQTKSEAAFFQPKLTIGKADDPYEREADAVADKVVSQTSTAASATSSRDANAVQKQEISSIQRLATPDEEKMPATNDERMAEDKKIQEKPIQRMENAAMKEEEKAPSVQKAEMEEEPLQAKAEEEEPLQAKAEEEEPLQAKAEEEEPLQAKADSGGGVASQAVTSKIDSTKGRGNPLPTATKGKMESAFGHDFSDVHIHTDTSSVELNRELNAQAFTHGKDIYFNSSKFNPENAGGERLLAHELTHVVQQGHNQLHTVQRTIAECEATHAAYKAYGDCRACKGNDTPQERADKIACLTNVIAGRRAYLAKDCDFILPNSIARGSDVAKSGHETQLEGLLTSFKKCK